MVRVVFVCYWNRSQQALTYEEAIQQSKGEQADLDSHWGQMVCILRAHEARHHRADEVGRRTQGCDRNLRGQG